MFKHTFWVKEEMKVVIADYLENSDKEFPLKLRSYDVSTVIMASQCLFPLLGPGLTEEN